MIKILVVDTGGHKYSSADLLKNLAPDWNILKAASGEQGFEKAVNEIPDLILLEINSAPNGYDTCRKLKNDSRTGFIPIIMVTALSELGDIERGIDCGTDDFLSKPVNKWELVTRVRTMLKLKHVTDKLERTLAYLNEVEKQSEGVRS